MQAQLFKYGVLKIMNKIWLIHVRPVGIKLVKITSVFIKSKPDAVIFE